MRWRPPGERLFVVSSSTKHGRCFGAWPANIKHKRALPPGTDILTHLNTTLWTFNSVKISVFGSTIWRFSVFFLFSLYSGFQFCYRLSRQSVSFTNFDGCSRQLLTFFYRRKSCCYVLVHPHCWPTTLHRSRAFITTDSHIYTATSKFEFSHLVQPEIWLHKYRPRTNQCKT